MAISFLFQAASWAAYPLEFLWEYQVEDRGVHWSSSTLPSGEEGPMVATRLISHIFSSPAVDAAGRIYFGAANGNLYCLDRDGQLVWKFVTGAEVQSSPVIGSDGTIYVGSCDGNFYAVKPDGTERWRFKTGDTIMASPGVRRDGTVYFGSRDRYFYALNADGTLNWKFATGGTIERPPVFGPDGTIYFGSVDGQIYALNLDGSERWRVSASERPDRVEPAGSIALGSDGVIYVATGAGEVPQLIAISPEGEVKWRYRFDPLLAVHYSAAPAIDSDGTLYVGASDGRIYAIRPDGTLKWRTYTGSLGFSAPAIGSDGLIYILGGNFDLFVLNRGGHFEHSFKMSGVGGTGGTGSSPNLTSDRRLYVGGGNGVFYAFRTPGGLLSSAWPTFQGDPMHMAESPVLSPRVTQSSLSATGALTFKASILDASTKVEASRDFQYWSDVATTRVGDTVTVQTPGDNGPWFYRLRYE